MRVIRTLCVYQIIKGKSIMCKTRFAILNPPYILGTLLLPNLGWLLDYSNQQADFSKEKTKPKGKDSCQLSQTEGHQLFSNFLFLYFHHLIYLSSYIRKKQFEPVSSQHFSESRYYMHQTGQFLQYQCISKPLIALNVDF